jgi:hypothetical protein
MIESQLYIIVPCPTDSLCMFPKVDCLDEQMSFCLLQDLIYGTFVHAEQVASSISAESY